MVRSTAGGGASVRLRPALTWGGRPAVPGTSTTGVPDALTDPHRIAAARRLLDEVSGHAAFDRLSALAARLVGAGHAKVTLFTDHDLVVGGFGLPAGVGGGPAGAARAPAAVTPGPGAGPRRP